MRAMLCSTSRTPHHSRPWIIPSLPVWIVQRRIHWILRFIWTLSWWILRRNIGWCVWFGSSVHRLSTRSWQSRFWRQRPTTTSTQRYARIIVPPTGTTSFYSIQQVFSKLRRPIYERDHDFVTEFFLLLCKKSHFHLPYTCVVLVANNVAYAEASLRQEVSQHVPSSDALSVSTQDSLKCILCAAATLLSKTSVRLVETESFT